jgi:DNA-binding XRE family transcriptional regulator
MKSTLKRARSSSSGSVREAEPIRIRRPQFVYQEGKPAFAVVPIDDWERIIEALDDLEDILFLEAYHLDPNEELLPAEMVDALLDGVNPIRIWREHRALSQQQLAEAAGISKPYLSQLECGRREASQRVIKRLAQALRVDLDDLIRPEPEDGSAAMSGAAPARKS